MNAGRAVCLACVLASLLGPRLAAALTLVADHAPRVEVTIGARAAATERHGAAAIQRHFRRLTGQIIPVREPRSNAPMPGTIAVGTPSSHPMVALMADQGRVKLAGLGSEGYHVLMVGAGESAAVVIAANSAPGAMYGAFAFIEALIAQQLGRTPVDVDFRVSPLDDLAIVALDERSTPFYPDRVSLESEPPDWLAGHRVNIAGAEGVWTGTGINDGIGAAVQYVLGFEALQDIAVATRQGTISNLRARTRMLSDRGVASYLFMYLTGEPTKATIARRPDLLGPAVFHPVSRDGVSYRPFCWSNPDVHTLFADLTREILRTYPDLGGFHLRAWGTETRACQCPKCGGDGEAAQELLWGIADTVMTAALAERPRFRFLLSGYDRSWFQDADRRHLRSLPDGTILLQKWGADGEPTADPMIPVELLEDVADAGHRMVILSSDTEEVQPLWMLEAELFSAGVLRYAGDANVRGLGGFTLQGSAGLGSLDKRLSARINWDPALPIPAYLVNALENLYGRESAPHLVSALLGNARMLSDFFLDFGGILTLTGGYGHGSRWFATRLWDVFGKAAFDDVVALPDAEAVAYAKRRLLELTEMQDQATQSARRAVLLFPNAPDAGLLDIQRAMEMWSAFLASRTRLVAAVEIGMGGGEAEAVRRELDAAGREMQRVRDSVSSILAYVELLGLSAQQTKAFVVERVDEEILALERLDAPSLIREIEKRVEEGGGEPGGFLEPFDLRDVLPAPSPVTGAGTFFVYTLTRPADSVAVDIYSASGRLVRRLRDLPAAAGVQEGHWDVRDSEGRRVANGVLFYRVTARQGDTVKRSLGRLAVTR